MHVKANRKRAILGPAAGVVAGVLMALASPIVAQESRDSAYLEAEKMPLAPQSLLLDIASIGDRFVAVGERGHILLSDDQTTWRQAESVPTRSTLTAVVALDDQLWAVGHDSVILHSVDRGENWTLQYADPAQTPEDDPNPFFDLHFIDDERGIVAGSYGRLMVTSNGGANWEEMAIGDLVADDELASDDEYEEAEVGDDEEELTASEDYEAQFGEEEQYYDYHLNGIAELGDGTLFIAGEAGTSYLSRDSGETWYVIEMPYEGSMFGALATDDGRFVAFGLRGHVLESADGGVNWEEVETDSLNSIMGGTVTDDGTEILVGSNGTALVRRSGGSSFVTYAFSGGEDLGGVIPITGINLLVVGESGVVRFTPGVSF